MNAKIERAKETLRFYFQLALGDNWSCDSGAEIDAAIDDLVAGIIKDLKKAAQA